MACQPVLKEPVCIRTIRGRTAQRREHFPADPCRRGLLENCVRSVGENLHGIPLYTAWCVEETLCTLPVVVAQLWAADQQTFMKPGLTAPDTIRLALRHLTQTEDWLVADRAALVNVISCGMETCVFDTCEHRSRLHRHQDIDADPRWCLP